MEPAAVVITQIVRSDERTVARIRESQETLVVFEHDDFVLDEVGLRDDYRQNPPLRQLHKLDVLDELLFQGWSQNYAHVAGHLR